MEAIRPRSILSTSDGLELVIDGFPKIYKRVGVYSLIFSAAVQLALIALVAGAISVNALATPAARSPPPEPKCEFPQSLSTMPCHDLIFVSSNSPTTRCQGPPHDRRSLPP